MTDFVVSSVDNRGQIWSGYNIWDGNYFLVLRGGSFNMEFNALHPSDTDYITMRGYAQLDTSSIGSDVISKVELYRLHSTDGVCDVRYLMVKDLPVPPTATEESYNAGVEVYAETTPALGGALLDLGAAGIANVNPSGITTLIIKNVIAYPTVGWDTNAIYNTAPANFYLRVTHAPRVRKKWPVRAAQ